jgi:hypothetical protein
MQIEKYCKYCSQIFFYDDGTDVDGLSGVADISANKVKREGFCPRCVDPHYIAGESYKKTVILELFRKHMKDNGVHVAVLDEDSLLIMMQSFPTSWKLFNSNGTYLTINLIIGTRFPGKVGEFEIGQVIKEHRHTTNEYGEFFKYTREIKCLRCGRVVLYNRRDTLEFYLQFKLKQCKNCDPPVGNPNGNTQNLNRNGSEKSEFSERAMAKALNVSRNDYRRHRPTERVPPLPNGTVVNGLIIRQSYWDEDPDSYSPKYILGCEKCKQTFICIQKNVHYLQHRC